MSHQENIKLNQLIEMPFFRNILTHFNDLNMRSDIGPILDSLIHKIIRTGIFMKRFQAPIECLITKLTGPITHTFRLKK